MSRGTKIVLAILGGLGLLGVIVVVAIYFVWKTKGPEWQAQLREAGQQVIAEGKAAGASATKDECTQLGLARLRQDSGFMGQVKVALFTEYCLDEAKGSLAFCADAPKEDEFLATATWRLKTSNALGLQDANNAVVKGIQKHCAGRATSLASPHRCILRRST